jgi:hypothetical protein
MDIDLEPFPSNHRKGKGGSGKKSRATKVSIAFIIIITIGIIIIPLLHPCCPQLFPIGNNFSVRDATGLNGRTHGGSSRMHG